MSSQHPHDLLDQHLDAYLAGELDPETAAAIHAYLHATSVRRGMIAGLRDAVHGERLGGDIASLHDARNEMPPLAQSVEAFRTKIDTERNSEEARSRIAQRGRGAPRWRWSLVGAGVGVVALLAIMIPTVRSVIRHDVSGHDAIRVYHTTPGQRSTISLVDGSTMTLAPSTTARMRSDGVAIDGEAYFQIVPRTRRVFQVMTNNAVVRVLGTSFTVRHYADEPRSRVMVEDGRVTLHRRDPHQNSQDLGTPTILSAHMLGDVTDSGIVVTSGVAMNTYTSLSQGRLVFRNVPLNDVVSELARAYGADIRVTDTTLARQEVTLAALVERDPLSQVLDVVTRAIDAHYTHINATFVIAPGRMPTRFPKSLRTPLPQQPEPSQHGR